MAFCFGKRPQNHFRPGVVHGIPGEANPNPSTDLRTGPAAAQLAEPVLSLVEGLKQCSPYLRSPLRFSAMPKAARNMVGMKRENEQKIK